ncbi:MAG: hypothetical protein KKA42_03330, partial [candidate division Zixibacteria bacterium]|nr:hypothetical protein [candidate division Zixibacteria bacterium]
MTDPNQLQSAVGSAIQRGPAGTSFTPTIRLEPVWGRITAAAPYDTPAHHYQWEQVYKDADDKWKPVAELHAPAIGGYHSALDGVFLLNPAVEVNSHRVEIGSIVRLIPSAVQVDGGYQMQTHRYWHFSYHELRPFKLTADLIPTGGGEFDTSVWGEWLDSPGETVELWPTHRSGYPSGDEFLSLGIGRGPGAYFRGTYGWARYQPKATAYVGPDGTQKWIGGWQIVTLYADLIQTAVVYTADIDPGDTGLAQLWWINKHQSDPTLINSTYQIKVFNDTDATLIVGDKMKVYFSRPHYVWIPLAGGGGGVKFAKVQTGWANTKGAAPATGSFGSEAVSVKTCEHDGTNEAGAAFDVYTIPKPTQDTALFDGYVIGYVTEEGTGDKVILTDIWDDPIGTVKWESVAVANIRDGWSLCDG